MKSEPSLKIAFVGAAEECPELLRCYLSSTADAGLELTAVADIEQAKATGFEWGVHFLDQQLTLSNLQDRELNNLCIDFLSKTLEFRTRRFVPGNEMLVKAVAGKKSSHPVETVLDATAGLGRDAFILALAGYEVSLFERSPLVAALLEDGLRRLNQAKELEEVSQRMSFRHGDSLQALVDGPGDSASWDVVYLDPMFPERKKSALVKKEMRIFKAIVGADLDADELLPVALSVAKQKVVVKRPKPAPFLNEQKPSHQLVGKTGRFDVYVAN